MSEQNPQPQIGEIEYELGVPIPGRILPQEKWAQTALRQLPDVGTLDFVQLFGRHAPTVLDIGCGNGRFVVSSAVLRPEFDHLGIDILPVVIRYATRRGRQRGLNNTRFAVCGGAEFLQRYVPRNSLTEIHVYHPQPFQNPNEKSLRLLTPNFFQQVHFALGTSGALYLQSDNPAYWEYLRTNLSQIMQWEEITSSWPEAPFERSRREIIARNQGQPIYRAIARRRDELSDESLKAIVSQLPSPEFTASPKRNRTGWTRRHLANKNRNRR